MPRISTGLSIARAKYPEPPRKAAARKKAVVKEPTRRKVRRPRKTAAAENEPSAQGKPLASNGAAPVAATKPEPAKPAAGKTGAVPRNFTMRIERWPAKFTRAVAHSGQR